MNSAYELQGKKRKYYNLIDGLSMVIKKIDESIENLNLVLKNFNESFNIDSQSADQNKISEYQNELIRKRDTLKNTIIPSIYEEIQKINKQIQQAELIANDKNNIGGIW